MTEAERTRNEKLGQKIVKALERRHFEAYYCTSKEEAKQKALELIPEDHVISWGGSETLSQIGLLQELRRGEYKVIDRDRAKTPEERTRLMREALLADTYLGSGNAVSEDGQIVNIDGNGNRVAAMTYGPTNVILVIGLNKVAATAEDALRRARHLAAPTNAQRFLPDTPCAKTGSCGDCVAKDCICAYISIIRLCRPAGKIKVILVGEPLGF